MNELVSVIIPTFKRPLKILMRAINSVLNQSYTNLELIIVDDSSKDDSNRNDVVKGIKKITDNRLIYVQHDCNHGACRARNTGIILSKGNYIAFLDDDDEWLPNKLELQLNKIKDSQAGLVYCDSYTITFKDNVQIKKNIRANRISGWVFDRLILDNFIGSTSFVLIRREALDSCGIFNDNMKSAQDYELWLRISKKYKVDFVDIPLVNYYIHNGERISTNVNNKIQGLENINEFNMSYLEQHPKALSIRKLKIVPYYAIKIGYKTALLKWFEAVKTYPFQAKNILYLIMIFTSKKYYNSYIRQ